MSRLTVAAVRSVESQSDMIKQAVEIIPELEAHINHFGPPVTNPHPYRVMISSLVFASLAEFATNEGDGLEFWVDTLSGNLNADFWLSDMVVLCRYTIDDNSTPAETVGLEIDVQMDLDSEEFMLTKEKAELYNWTLTTL